MLIVNKFNSFFASILKNTNKLVSSSNDNLGGIRAGSYIKIGNDDVLYSIVNSKKIFYTKNFEVVNNRTLKINDNTGITLQKEDIIKIIYDEYKFGSILNIIKPGKFYNEGDILTIKGGELSIDISNGIGYPTKLKVEEINELGGVSKLGLESEGKYIVPPQGKIECFGSNGENLVLELEYKILDNRNIQEKVIKNIEFKDNTTFITLDYSLPMGIKIGNLSTEKWEATLGTNYYGENSFNINCSIFKDLTPNLQIPLITKNSTSFDNLINKGFFIIDDRIGKLEREIELLKKRNR